MFSLDFRMRSARTLALAALAMLAACTAERGAPPPRVPVVAAGAATLTEEPSDTVATPAGVAEFVRAHHPGLRVELLGSQPARGSRYGLTTYEFASNEEGDGYGSGMVLWTGRGTPVGDVRLNGDSPPHTVRWLDFDGDGRRDLFVLWGAEDELGTGVFLDRGADRFSDSAFVPAYVSHTEYASLLDLDGDGRPEIVEPDGWKGGEAEEWPCTDMDVPAGVRRDAAREYARLARGVGDANFTYGEDRDYEPTVMALWMPVRILAVRGTRAVDVTREQAGHVRWRLGMLQRMRAAGVSKACAAELGRVAGVMRERAGLPGT
jgi:hypothetical protein